MKKYTKPKIKMKNIKSLFLKKNDYPLNYFSSLLAYCDWPGFF